MSWTTNHNKAAVHGLVSQPITAYVGHLCWQLPVATVAPLWYQHIVMRMRSTSSMYNLCCTRHWPY